jgi:membrane protein YqaA with SNARE-associated domain
LLFAVGITIIIILRRDQIEHLAVYGYPANFLVSLLSSATVIVPTPSFALVLVTGSVLNPVGVGIAAGLGAALGEMTGYLAGFSGQRIFHEWPLYQRVQRLMEKSDTLIIFIMAFVPNPVFDVGGIIAGIMRMPAWRFLLACCVGKSLRFVLLALSVDFFNWRI